MFRALLSNLFNFLYPKTEEVLALESLSQDELLSRLTSAKNISNDTIAIWNYADPNVRKLIWEIKYHRNAKVIETTSRVLFDIVSSEILDKEVTDNFVDPLLIPIPISKERRLERGYNQTELLCEQLKRFDTENFFEYSPTALSRVVHTESQTKIKNKKRRLENTKDIMETTESVRGRNIILSGGVTTTGATLSDARRALRAHGAKKIICFTLAH